MSAPALTGRIWGILLRNEWTKARKRMAFLLPLGFFLFVTLMGHGSSYYDARNDPDRTFALPEVWSDVFGQDFGTFMLIFASICLIMLVSSEFTWRTARQNVIDGLSKTQWFIGKSMLIPVVGLLFIILSTLIGGVIGWMGTDAASATGPLLSLGVVKAAGALFLAFVSIGGLALFVSLAVRGSGGAMAVWFLWISPMEQLIVPGLLGRIEFMREYIQYQPFLSAQRLLGFEKWDPAAFQRLVEASREAEREIPPPPDMAGDLWVNAAWAVAFGVGAFLMFRRRDL